MGWLGRLLGKDPPKVPAGGRAFVCQEDDLGTWWTIRVAMPGEPPSDERPRLKGSPEFAELIHANAYLDWVTGAAPSFTYPDGPA